jgi:hypothetical protein
MTLLSEIIMVLGMAITAVIVAEISNRKKSK